MVDREHDLPMTRNAKLPGISRRSVYYLPLLFSDADLSLMRRIDELRLERPFMDGCMLRRILQREGVMVGRRHVATLMQRMDIEAMCPQPGTSKANPGHKIHPYLLRMLAITRSNQSWAIKTTYIPMARGFAYLPAVVDVASRKVLEHKVEITLEACHAKEVIEQAPLRQGTLYIVNTDQGSQFAATEFTDVVLAKGCKPSMGGRSAWRHNVFIERFWRSVKYKRVYLRAYDSVGAACTDIAPYIAGFNG